MINTLGGTANTANKGMDDRGLILNVPNWWGFLVYFGVNNCL
jgi:hypothetical protein